VYCANGRCGSLGRFVGTGQTLTPTNFSMRWGPAGPPSDEEVFGRGCDPTALPTGTERDLVNDLIEMERNKAAEIARCTGQRASFCMGAVAQGYAPKLQEKQDEITAYCMMVQAQQAALPADLTRSDTTLPPAESTAPLETHAGMSGKLKFALVGGALVLALGTAYVFTKGKR